MNIININPKINYLYHYTLKKNVNKILDDKAIISKDQYVFFTKSLKDSINAFKREMMVEGKLYIDIDGVLRKRSKCNMDDYCILKIPYKNDNEFYEFKFDGQSKESIYSISVAHKGSYHFEKAKILDFPKNKDKRNNIIIKTALTAAMTTGIVLFPYNSFAASWLDSNNFDTSWYVDTTASEYTINNEQEMAGLAYLVNYGNVSFESKSIKVTKDMDLSKNKWQTIKDIFKGNICGGHRFILNCLDGKLIENRDITAVEYLYKIRRNSENYISEVSLKNPYTVEKLKEITRARAVFLNNKELADDVVLTSLTLSEDDIFEIFTNKYMTVENSDGLKIPFRFESGDSIDNVKVKYSKKTNIPPEKLVIKYKGKELSDGRTLADYNIQMDSTLNVYVKVNINLSVNNGHGSVDASSNSALSGDMVTITLKPDQGYELDEITVNGKSLKSEVTDNKLQIKCKNEDINVIVSYKSNEVNNSSETESNNINKDTINQKDNSKNNYPKTGDNFLLHIVTIIVSVCAVIILKIKKKKS